MLLGGKGGLEAGEGEGEREGGIELKQAESEANLSSIPAEVRRQSVALLSEGGMERKESC